MQPLRHLGVLVREGVHRPALGRQFGLRDQRMEEHALLAVVMEMAGELAEEGGEARAVLPIRRAVDECVDVAA